MSKKVGLAVRRNRIKRILRETLRLHRSQFPSTGWMVVRVGADSDELALREDFLHLGHQALQRGADLKLARTRCDPS